MALNNAHQTELSWLDLAGLSGRLDAALHARTTLDRTGLLIAFDQASVISFPNLEWFRARLPRFVYIDRVVVAPARRGAGLARLLYADLAAAAVAAGHTVLCCEVNCVPPNPASAAFHARLGFSELGRGGVPGMSKTVRYLLRPLRDAGTHAMSSTMETDQKRTGADHAAAHDAERTPPASLPHGEPMPPEQAGPKGPEPTRFGDWEQKGRCTDF